MSLQETVQGRCVAQSQMITCEDRVPVDGEEAFGLELHRFMVYVRVMREKPVNALERTLEYSANLLTKY
jgi:hypothetical protein